MITIGNIHTLERQGVDWSKDPKYVYAGRAGHGRDGYYGNPVRRGDICPECGKQHMTNGSTLPCFRIILRRRLSEDEELKDNLLQAWNENKIFLCFCHPQICHIGVIIEETKALIEQESSENPAIGDFLESLPQVRMQL